LKRKKPVSGTILKALGLRKIYAQNERHFPSPWSVEETAACFIVVTTTGRRSAHWVKVKNPKAPAVMREAEQDWGS
jgi:hypothetical protein